MTNTSSIRLLFAAVSLLVLCACKETGFRKLEGASERATIQSANETLKQIEVALERFKEVNHRYPATSEQFIVDSLRDYFLIPVDAAFLYKNEKDQSSYIAVGGRKNKIVYHYPATLGSGEYTLYWIGLNAVDEDGRGDDLFLQSTSSAKQLSRHQIVAFRDDSANVEFSLSATGGDIRKDSVIFQLRSGQRILFTDRWLLRSYTNDRPELNERERQEIVGSEFDRFLRQSHFLAADSLAKNSNSSLTRRIDQKDFAALAKAKLPVFTYYSASGGSKAIYWSTREKRIVVLRLEEL